MEKAWYWKTTIVIGVVLLALYYVAPTALYLNAPPEVRRSSEKLKETIPNWLPEHRMNLGIDLQGGLHLVMGVDTNKAVLNRADRLADSLIENMKEDKQKPLVSARRMGDEPTVRVELQNEEDFEALNDLLKFQSDTWSVDSHNGKEVLLKMSDAYAVQIKDDAVAQAQTTLRSRIDFSGTKEPEVRRRGENSILIQIAGLTADEEESVKDNIIGKTAQLEFKVVDDKSQYFVELSERPDFPKDKISLERDMFEDNSGTNIVRPYLESEDKAEIQKWVALFPPPADRIVRIQEVKNGPKGAEKAKYQTWLLDRKTPLTGDSLVDAFATSDNEEGGYYVAMNFDQKGAMIFERLTRENAGHKMAIVLDDAVDSAPRIEGPIAGGRARITMGGGRTQDEVIEDARALAVVLKAGALPAPVYPQEQRTVGATLGDDAVSKGKQAMAWAIAAVVVLMVVYYKWTGLSGVIAMSINLLLLMAGMSALDATLTLPGIAGLALTVGMAVDANIVQFERIRDELALGKSPKSAVDAGFEKAFSAIFDANVTTLLAAIVLYQYGSGPIRGFATTLGLGVFINTFTAVIVPRLILEFTVRNRSGRRTQEISI